MVDAKKTREDAQELAAYVLQYGKRLAPDRFPQPSMEAVNAWAGVLAGMPFPREVWPEAVKLWATELVGDRMVTPREMKRAATLVVERWERDPQRKRELDAHREARRVERDRQLAEGTFGEVRGYRPREVEAPQSQPSVQDIQAIAERLRARRGA
ncbi:hypothetical protein [Corynebacterium accolens]|uniref:hypothetical protein n=1 Tax=Corynebacterium accolens TaxID=38284 RepID=UPI00255012AF|nr:hypothetical protein [Corynebacterium accolens]MDK8505581.1 hypothetical protein [Corynebacterium accolens]MDK8662431.1 hypothetical protein [Corynebacterium accolens]